MSVPGSILRMHQALYERTDGRVGHKMIGVPSLLLRSTGRRTGATPTNALIYAKDGDEYLVVPSNAGADQPPAWLYNIGANPQVEIQLGRQRRPATATIIGPEDESYERRWQLVNAGNRDRYTAYQAQTSRPIPVVALSPR